MSTPRNDIRNGSPWLGTWRAWVALVLTMVAAGAANAQSTQDGWTTSKLAVSYDVLDWQAFVQSVNSDGIRSMSYGLPELAHQDDTSFTLQFFGADIEGTPSESGFADYLLPLKVTAQPGFVITGYTLELTGNYVVGAGGKVRVAMNNELLQINSPSAKGFKLSKLVTGSDLPVIAISGSALAAYHTFKEIVGYEDVFVGTEWVYVCEPDCDLRQQEVYEWQPVYKDIVYADTPLVSLDQLKVTASVSAVPEPGAALMALFAMPVMGWAAKRRLRREAWAFALLLCVPLGWARAAPVTLSTSLISVSYEPDEVTAYQTFADGSSALTLPRVFASDEVSVTLDYGEVSVTGTPTLTGTANVAPKLAIQTAQDITIVGYTLTWNGTYDIRYGGSVTVDSASDTLFSANQPGSGIASFSSEVLGSTLPSLSFDLQAAGKVVNARRQQIGTRTVTVGWTQSKVCDGERCFYVQSPVLKEVPIYGYVYDAGFATLALNTLQITAHLVAAATPVPEPAPGWMASTSMMLLALSWRRRVSKLPAP